MKNNEMIEISKKINNALEKVKVDLLCCTNVSVDEVSIALNQNREIILSILEEDRDGDGKWNKVLVIGLKNFAFSILKKYSNPPFAYWQNGKTRDWEEILLSTLDYYLVDELEYF